MKQLIHAFSTLALKIMMPTLLGLMIPYAVAEENAPIYLTADQIDSDNQKITVAKGNVTARQEDLRINAQWMRYNSNTSHILAGNTITLVKSSNILIGKQLDLKIDTYQGKINDPIYFINHQFARGNAEKLFFVGQNKYRLKKGRFTTCDLGDDSWYIRAKDMDVDFTQSNGVARHAVFEFKSLPLFYIPWMKFPLNSERRSGLLTPILGSSSNDGIHFGLPYYWNIAPNYDATITPHVYTKRGLMLGGEFRYLQPTYQGNISAEYLPNDQKTHQDRYAWKILHQQNFGSHLNLYANLQSASDSDYFTDFSNNIQSSATADLPRDIILSYQSHSWWSASIRSQQYQTLKNNTKPYARSPQLLFNATPPLPQPYILDIAGEFNRFTHPTFTTGDRFIAYPRLQIPLETSYSFIRPQIGVHSTIYSLNSDRITPQHRYTRVLPIMSLDAGLIFERKFKLAQNDIIQTLEPRLYYVYIPYKDQSFLPNFDSADTDFSFAQMFRTNQFSGNDRINNANQLTSAITTRFYDVQTGLERLRLGIGQRIYFTNQLVSLSAPARPIAQNRSDIIISASSEFWKNLSASATWQYSAKDSIINKSSLELAWHPALAKTINLRYRFDRTDPDQIKQFDLTGQWPINGNWYAVGRYNYSIKDKKALDTIAGLQYNAGCWGLQFVMQRYVSDANKMNKTFYIMLHLRSISGIGSNPINLLRDRIPNYSTIY